MACTNTRAIEPPAEQSFEEAIRPIVDRVRVREMRVAEALRRYHEGSDRGELKALLIEMWGPPVEATAAEKEASPRCGRTTVILAKRRICVLPASHDGVHEDDVGAWWTEGESDPVFAREAAAHPTMMGLAGGGSPSVGPMCMNCNEAPRGERCAGLCFRCANGFEVRREVERLKPSVPTGRGAAGLESAIGAAIELSEAEPGVTFHVYGPMREDSDWLRASVKDAKTAPNSGVSRWR